MKIETPSSFMLFFHGNPWVLILVAVAFIVVITRSKRGTILTSTLLVLAGAVSILTLSTMRYIEIRPNQYYHKEKTSGFWDVLPAGVYIQSSLNEAKKDLYVVAERRITVTTSEGVSGVVNLKWYQPAALSPEEASYLEGFLAGITQAVNRKELKSTQELADLIISTFGGSLEAQNILYLKASR